MNEKNKSLEEKRAAFKQFSKMGAAGLAVISISAFTDISAQQLPAKIDPDSVKSQRFLLNTQTDTLPPVDGNMLMNSETDTIPVIDRYCQNYGNGGYSNYVNDYSNGYGDANYSNNYSNYCDAQ